MACFILCDEISREDVQGELALDLSARLQVGMLTCVHRRGRVHVFV